MAAAAQKENKRISTSYAPPRDEIEVAFGENLGWDWDEARGCCHVRKASNVGGYRDAERRHEIQQWMIEHMVQLERALSPHISKLRQSG